MFEIAIDKMHAFLVYFVIIRLIDYKVKFYNTCLHYLPSIKIALMRNVDKIYIIS